MATILNYNFVASDEENGVLIAGFVNDEFSAQEYLLFQAWLDPEAEDGDDEIYIERDDQSQGTYGGVKQLVLSRDHALLRLSPETAEILGTEQEVDILFSATDEQFQQLRADLGIVFASKPGFELRQ